MRRDTDIFAGKPVLDKLTNYILSLRKIVKQTNNCLRHGDVPFLQVFVVC
jgi:hypothetical protein